MTVQISIIVTGAVMLLFAATFIFGYRVALLRPFLKNPHSILSFGAGMSVAYVFVHLMPELHEARQAFVKSVSITLQFEGMAIYYLSLIGFLVFYGLNHLRARQQPTLGVGKMGLAFTLQICGFAAYVWLMSYLLLHQISDTPVPISLYALAITFHFLALDHTLHNEHGTNYERTGRFALAAAAISGWMTGLLFTLPHHILALLVAFISGAIIMNSTVMELSSKEDARFLPFLAGGMIYGLILLPI